MPLEVLDDMESVTLTWRDIPGWFDFEDVYRDAVASADDGAVFVEVGAWKGRSTAFLANEIRLSGKTIDFHVVDSFLGDEGTGFEEVYEEFRFNMWRTGSADQLNVIRSDSVAATQRFGIGSIEFVFIDAAHDLESVRRDLAAWQPRVRSGGILAGHDYLSHPGVRQAVDERFPRVDVRGNCWIVRVE